MSASEMLALLAYLGDLVPQGDEYWDLYVLLHQIVFILLDSMFSKNTVEYLKTLIQEYHELFGKLFGVPLKPKHHFLLHYPDLIMRAAPVKYTWSMRYEAYHKLLKSTANSVTSRKNILLQ